MDMHSTPTGNCLPALRRNLWFGALLVAFVGIGCESDVTGPPFAPDQALSTFHLPEGFRIELVAAEPLIADPVAMDIDEFGRIFVAEMPGYPLDVGGTGRIKLLHDTDGDGQPDMSILFADGLRLPTGLMRWKQGVLVTDPPDLLYLADTDGDGIADKRTVILTGFALSNAQHNANKPLYGMDNWIYVANNGPIWWTEKYRDPFGDQGSEIHYPAFPDSVRLPRNGADRNIRLKPDAIQLESLSSRSQFGQTFDPWGRHFLVDNSHHHYMEVIAARYFENSSQIPVAQAIHYTSDQGNPAQVFPVTRNPEHQLLTDRGVFTSACGLIWYAGGLFPAPYDQNVTFVAEPVHNLIHVDRVVNSGTVFTAQRIEQNREFLASTDGWFRPVNFSVGPDGALYVVDYYRRIIEHPEWMDDEAAASDDITHGTDRGRLYRIVPENSPAMDWHDRVDLGQLPSADLVEHLESSNKWWRMQAQRLLVTRHDVSATDRLIAMAQSSPHPEARIHALWTLDGLGRLDSGLIKRSLVDIDPRVRENAILLTEQHVQSDPSMVRQLLDMENDPNIRVRFQLVNSLGRIRSSATAATIERLLWKDIDSDWIQTAALLAYRGDPLQLLQTAMDRPGLPQIAGDKLIIRLAAAVAETQGLVPTLTQSGPRRSARLSGAAEGLQRSPDRFNPSEEVIRDLLELILDNAAPTGDAAMSALRQMELPALAVEPEALAIARDSTLKPATRRRATELLALTGSGLDILGELLANQFPAPVQMAVLEALESRPGLSAARLVLERWAQLTPRIRKAALDIFNDQDRAELLVTALEDGNVLPEELLWQHRVRLMRDTKEPVRSRARALLQLPAERTIDTQVSEEGDYALGQDVFLTYCAQCHVAGDIGNGDMGPDLATVQHWPRHAILSEIQDPGKSIASGYEQWQLRLLNGETVQGVVSQDSPTTLTVVSLSGRHVVRMDQVENMLPLTDSGMPPNLHLTMTDAELAGLLTFITEFVGAPADTTE